MSDKTAKTVTPSTPEAIKTAANRYVAVKGLDKLIVAYNKQQDSGFLDGESGINAFNKALGVNKGEIGAYLAPKIVEILAILA